jgi:hypothetical protein
MRKGRLDAYKLTALQGTASLNRGLDLDQLHVPVLTLECGTPVNITNSKGLHQLFWKCSGCDHDRQHYRKCTAKTLQSQEDLACPFCPVRPRGQLVLPAGITVCSSEGRFMQLLWTFGLDREYCHQVVPPFWKWPVDFYSYVAGLWVLVDDRHHWTGIHQYSKGDIADKDMRCNLAALGAGSVVVRVHAADMLNPSCVLAALVEGAAAARAGAPVVLTPSYASCWIEWQGSRRPYVDTLLNPGMPGQQQLRQRNYYKGISVITAV